MGRESSETVQDPMVVALGRVPLFSALSLEDLETLATVTSTRPLDVGTVLTTEGEVGEEFFVIERGVVTISAHDRQLRTLGVGDFLGEIAILFGGDSHRNCRRHRGGLVARAPQGRLPGTARGQPAHREQDPRHGRRAPAPAVS